MKKAIVLIATLSMLIAAPMAIAGTQQGDIELSINANVTVPDDGDESGSVYGGINWFLTDGLSLGTAVMTLFGEDIGYYLYLEPNYHFNTASTFVPYVGVNGAYADLGGDLDSDITYGVQAGVKAFFTEDVALKVEVRRGLKSDFESTIINAGLSIFF